MRRYIKYLFFISLCILSVYGNCVKNCSENTKKPQVTKIILIEKKSSNFKFYFIPIPIVIVGVGASIVLFFRRRLPTMCCGSVCCRRESTRPQTMPSPDRSDTIPEGWNNHSVIENRKLPRIPSRKPVSIVDERNGDYVVPNIEKNNDIHYYEIPMPNQDENVDFNAQNQNS